MIAAAEARDKAHKDKLKPISKINKEGRTLRSTDEQRQLEKERLVAMEAQAEPMSTEAIKAIEAAKAAEAKLAAELGYNPYETARSSAGQARNATATVVHGAITADKTGGPLPSITAGGGASIPAVVPPLDPASALVEPSQEFEDAYSVTVSTNSSEVVNASFGIMRKLIINATTKGQNTDDTDGAAKFRHVRLTNAKIKAAIVDVQGAVEMMLATGFQLPGISGRLCPRLVESRAPGNGKI